MLIFTVLHENNSFLFFKKESYHAVLDLHFTFTTIDFFQNDEDLKRQATHQNKMFNPIKKDMLQKKCKKNTLQIQIQFMMMA